MGKSCGVIFPSSNHPSFRHACSISQCHRYTLKMRDSPKANRDTATATPVHLLRSRQAIQGLRLTLRERRRRQRSRTSNSHTRRRRQDPDPDYSLEKQLPRTSRPNDPTFYRVRSPSLTRVKLYPSREAVMVIQRA